MSMHEFRMRYIFGATWREMKLAVLCAIFSGVALVLLANMPGADQAQAAAKVVGGLNSQELLALVTLASLALSAWIIRIWVAQTKEAAQQHGEATAALTRIADRMDSMECIKTSQK
jgi:hypothetical protein